MVLERRDNTRLCVVFLSLLAFAVYAAPSDAKTVQSRPDKKMVFYLNSYHNGYMWSDRILEGIQDQLSTSTYPIELQIEYLDSKKYHYSVMSEKLFQLFKSKYTHVRFDVVIVSDNNALTFMLEYGERLFPGVPVVFCGINARDAPDLDAREYTGVLENVDIVSTLEVALSFHPNKQNVVVVGDESATGVAIRKQIEQAMPHFQRRLQVEYWDNFELHTILERLTRLEKDTIVFFVPFYQNIAGSYYSTEELLQLVTRQTDAPIYSNWEFMLGFGVVGGKIISGYQHGQDVARLAIRVLDGEKPTSIPVEKRAHETYMFDYKVMKKQGIDIDLAPEGSIFMNEPTRFYELQKQVFWTIMVSLIILLIILALLARNIVRRREVEHRIIEQLAFLEILLNTIPLLICWKDKQQRYLGVNRSFTEFFNMSGPEDVLSRTDKQVHMDEEFASHVAALDREVVNLNKSIVKHKLELRDKNGASRWLDVTKVPLRDPQGNVVGTLTTADNITRQVSLQRQLLQSQKMEAIGTLAGGVAHDFNNILTSIINSTELALTDIEAESLAGKDLERVLKAAHRGSGVVKQILTFSRPNKEDFTNVNLSETVLEALHLLERSVSRNIKVRSHVEAEQAMVMADRTQLHQVVMNLCTNAYQALRDSGGQLDVHLVEALVDNELGQLLDVKPGLYVKLTVADNGPGIPPDILDKVFDPFFTTKGKSEGTGLGLAVVHSIVKGHQGGLLLQSKPWVRTSMEIFLPIIDQQCFCSLEELQVSPSGEERVLFVEDDEDQLATTPRILESLGYQVTACRNPATAMNLVRDEPDAFQLIITDFDMPGANGLELAREVSIIREDLPVIMVSGREKVLNLATKENNIAKVLVKPYTKSSLSQAIRQILGN